ncbi:Ig-like domain-containing protein [Desulfopila sp. IMCC35008]|uniref:Ig-like domain-containing protein n=1 Tax=Desulfopila sp. IMCC35008 TaxID=2653858 RepID=UPI0013CF6530|nr:Ig-like domain-containing protein [Desulfopila sp. IMCC35008]
MKSIKVQLSLVIHMLLMVVALFNAGLICASTDISDMVILMKSRFMFDRSTNENYFDAYLTNISGETLEAPFRIVIGTISNPAVTVANPDGYTEDNNPYFEYNSPASLIPDESTVSKQWRFSNPTRVRFDFTIASLESTSTLDNNLPISNAGEDQSHTLAHGQETILITLDGSVSSDPDGEQISYLWSGTPDPDDVVSPEVLVSAGNHTFSLVVSDTNGGSSETDSVTITILPAPNEPPAISADQQHVVMNEGNTLSISISATDPDSDQLSLSGTSIPDNAEFVLSNEDSNLGTFTFNPGFDQAGTYQVVFTAEDPSGAKTALTVEIQVDNTNLPPQITSTAITTATEGIPYEYDVIASDPDGDQLILTTVNGPIGMTVDQQNKQLYWTPTGAQVGDITVGIQVADVEGLTDLQEFTIAVQPVNDPPELISTPIVTGEAFILYSYQVLAVDPEDDQLTFSLQDQPESMFIDPLTGLITWSPGESEVGSHAVAVTVSDGKATTIQTYVLQIEAAKDRTPPRIDLIAPAQVQAGTSLGIRANVTDNAEVSLVSFSIDNLEVKQFTSGPFVLEYNAPEEVGTTLQLIVVATDTSGNTSVERASVLVVDEPDTIPPEISLFHPNSAAPGETIRMRAEATDNYGVIGVNFSAGQNGFASIGGNPYETDFIVPDDATVGTEIHIAAEALDAEGNSNSAQGVIQLVETGDNESPVQVAVNVPANAQHGQEIVVHASAIDNVGILKIIFLADNVIIGEDVSPPYDLSYPIPETMVKGSKIEFVARAVDFSGHSTDSDSAETTITGTRSGFLVGEVYDDSTGLPLKGAVIRAGQPEDGIEWETDASGRYELYVPENITTLTVEKDGYTSSIRQPNVLPDEVNRVLDSRLTPLTYYEINNLTGTNLQVEGEINIYVPPGSLPDIATITVSPLSGQGLPHPLPAGWAPVMAFDIGSSESVPNNPLELALKPSANIDGLIAVYWNNEVHEWIRLEGQIAGTENQLALDVQIFGTVALVKADTLPIAPETPQPGQVLVGVNPQILPESISADILPDPEIIFMQPGSKSAVTLLLNTQEPQSSGTVVEVDFTEYYKRYDATLLTPASMTQDIILYQEQNGFVGHFIATPSEIFDPMLLEEGKIQLSAHRTDGAITQNIVTKAGGTVAGNDGVTLLIPPGALELPTSVTISSSSTGVDLALPTSQFYTPLSSVKIDLGENSLSTSVILQVPLPDSAELDKRIALIRKTRVAFNTVFELIGLGAVDNTIIEIGAGSLGLPLPGVLESGEYILIQLLSEVGFISGSVISEGQPVTSAKVTSNQLPFVSLQDARQPSYAMLAPLAVNHVSGEDLSNGNSSSVAVTIEKGDQIVTRNLELIPVMPTVISSNPANNETNVAVSSPISVVFSTAMAEETLTGAFELSAGSSVVQGTVSLFSDQKTAVFVPAMPLAENATYTMRLAETIADKYLNLLSGNQDAGSYEFTFHTVDSIAPEEPDPGTITTSIPYDGETLITGTKGTSEPGTVMTAVNTTTGVTVSVIVDNDGSFVLSLSADLSDSIELIFTDQAGNSTEFVPPPFQDADGTIVIGSEGGTVEGPNDLQVIIPAGVIPDGTPIRVDAAEEAEFEAEISPLLPYVIGFDLKIPEGVEATDEFKISFPLPEGSDITEDSQLFLLKEVDFLPFKSFYLSNIAKVNGDRIETASPPFRGVRSVGKFYVASATVTMQVMEACIAGTINAIATASPVAFAVAADAFQLSFVPSSETTFFPIYAVPLNKPYSIVGYDQTGVTVYTKSSIEEEKTLISQMFIAETDTSEMALIGSYPEDISDRVITPYIYENEGSAPIDLEVILSFNKDIVTPEDQSDKVILSYFVENEEKIIEGELKSYREEEGVVSSNDDLAQTISFLPAERLKFNTYYTLKINSLGYLTKESDEEGSDDIIASYSGNIKFKTFSPKIIGSTDLFEKDEGGLNSSWTDSAIPNDLAILTPDLAAVAIGNYSSPSGMEHDVALIDISEPDKPRFLKESEAGNGIEGKTSSLLSFDNSIIVAHSGLNIYGNISLLDYTTGENPTLEYHPNIDGRYRKFLTSSLSDLQAGMSPLGIPPVTGLPRDIANLGNNVYIATTGVGIQGVVFPRPEDEKDELPSLWAMDKPMVIATLRDKVITGTIAPDSLIFLNDDLSDSYYTIPDIPVTSIKAIQEYPITKCSKWTNSTNCPEKCLQGSLDEDCIDKKDLVFIGGRNGSFYIVDASEYIVDASEESVFSYPELEREIVVNEDGSRIRSIAINPRDGLAYLSSSDGIKIIDISDPLDEKIPNYCGGGDSEKEECKALRLGYVEELSETDEYNYDKMALSEDYTKGFLTSLTGDGFKAASLLPGRLYVDTYDSDFADLALNRDDYYPDLGKKELKVRALDLYYEPGEGDIEVVEVTNQGMPTDLVKVTPIRPELIDGVALFNVEAPKFIVDPEDSEKNKVKIHFRWKQNNTNFIYELNIRDNTITTIEDVLNGKAVFVAKANYRPESTGVGKTKRDKGTTLGENEECAVYSDAPKARYKMGLDKQKFDMLEEMLNQVLSRKYTSSQKHKRLLNEDGLFDELTQKGLKLFKTEFNHLVNFDEYNSEAFSSTFSRIISDYPSVLESIGDYTNKIVDRKTLVGDTYSESDIFVNDKVSTIDTGLFELYDNVVKAYIENLIKKAEDYRDLANVRWYSRDNDNVISENSQGNCEGLLDGKRSVGYSYGARNTKDEFIEYVTSTGAAPSTSAFNSSDTYKRYRGHLDNDGVPVLLDNDGIPIVKTGMKWTGLLRDERNMPGINLHFEPRYWTGIDCSGLIYRCIEYAEAHNEAKNDPSWQHLEGNFPNLYNLNAKKLYYIQNEIYDKDGKLEDYGTSRKVVRLDNLKNQLHIGDLRVSKDHVVMAYSDPGEYLKMPFYIIHASGQNRYRTGIAGTNSSKFGRKVVTTSSTLFIKGKKHSRIILWK